MGVKRTSPESLQIELERFLPYRLNVAAESVSRALSQLYSRRHGISIAEWRVIATLGQFHRMAAKDIGRHSRMHKTKVSRAVARLEKRSCITRQSNSKDLREAFLELTPEGKKIYYDLVPRVLAFEAGLSEGFSADELKILEQLLGKLEATARNGNGDEMT